MEDEDEIDVLGEFNLESLLTKNEEQISSCYDGEHQLGLSCDSQWILDTTSQASWYDTRSDPQPSFGALSTINFPESYDTNNWSDKERYLLDKGLELFGRSWSRLAQYIGSKTSGQVKAYVKAMGVGWAGKCSVSTSSFGVDSMDFNFTELIDDMEIPASIEEVIAAVSTAQPTVVLPSSQKEVTIAPNTSSSRKLKCRRKRNITSGSKRNQVVTQKSKEITQIYNAEDIKDVLTGYKEQDSIVLPNGEQVMRIRHGSSLSEGSDVDIDIDSEESVKKDQPLKKDFQVEEKMKAFKGDEPEVKSVVEEKVFQAHKETSVADVAESNCNSIFELTVDDIEKEVSVLTNGISEDAGDCVERDRQVFKGSLVTPSGRVMTVIVDDMPSNFSAGSFAGTQSAVSKYTSSIQDRLDEVYQLPPPTQELFIEPLHVTQEEKLLHPEFFSKTHQGLNRYLKIRNHIVNCWRNSRPNYVTKTSVRAGLRNCGDVNLISRIHAYLEQKGYINFGCKQCHYSGKSGFGCDEGEEEPRARAASSNSDMQQEKRESGRARKKKLPFEEICVSHKLPAIRNPNKQSIKSNKLEGLRIPGSWKPRKKKMVAYPELDGGYTMEHTDSGEVILQHSLSKPTKITTRGIKPVKLIHCKNYSVTNKAPYRVELDVSALLLVDVHSHLSPKCEVIGLLGGSHSVLDNVLSITTAVPCRTVLSSNIHCDMCPVSQCESSELITSQGLSVVGWYHSHPNFDPSPSDTDVNTQNTLQSWFNETGKPFVGLIIAPYFPVHNISSYRCCQVKMESSGPIPYQLEVKLTSLSNNNLLSLRQSIDMAYKTLPSREQIKQLNIYKCLESVKHHVKRASPKVDEEIVSHVLQEIRDFFKDISVKSSLLI